MPLHFNKKRFPYLYDSIHTIEKLEDMYEETNDREEKRQIRRLINERTNPGKPKSDAYIWSQAHNFMLFMVKGVRGNMGAVIRSLADLRGTPSKAPNEVLKRYGAEYHKIWGELYEVQKKLLAIERKLKAISALRKQDKIDDRANRP